MRGPAGGFGRSKCRRFERPATSWSTNMVVALVPRVTVSQHRCLNPFAFVSLLRRERERERGEGGDLDGQRVRSCWYVTEEGERGVERERGKRKRGWR